MKRIFFLFILLLGFASVQAQNPFAEYGYEPKIATLSNGKYNEFFDQDTIVQIGSVLFNTKSQQIVAFVETDTLYPEATLEPDIVSRWLSPDPLADEMSSWSPYNYAFDNPIKFTDPDGRAPKPFDDYFDKKTGKYLGTDGVGDGIRLVNSKTWEANSENGRIDSKVGKSSAVSQLVTEDASDQTLTGILNFYAGKAGIKLSTLLDNKVGLDVSGAMAGTKPKLENGRVNMRFARGEFSGLFQNSKNLTNTLVHEGRHGKDVIKGIPYNKDVPAIYWGWEQRAMASQIQHSSWKGTTIGYKSHLYKEYAKPLFKSGILSQKAVDYYFGKYGIGKK